MSQYRAYNKRTGAWASPAIPLVAAPVALTGVATTSGSNLVTVTSTTGLFPFMGLSVPNLPKGSFILAVKSATVIVAAAPLHSTTTGEWTVTEANANATATATGMLGQAHGFNPVPIPEPITDGEVWRNTFNPSYKSSSVKVLSPAAVGPFAQIDPNIIHGGLVPARDAPLYLEPEYNTLPMVAAASFKIALSDEFDVKPWRAKTKWRHLHHLVHTAGDVTTVPAHEDIALVRIAND